MCWYSTMLIPIKLKKPMRVYKVGIRATPNRFVCKYINHVYLSNVKNKTIQLEYDTYTGNKKFNVYSIQIGYHSYKSFLGWAMKKDLNMLGNKIGVFEIPKGATIYINKFGEIVSSDIKYLYPIEVNQ